MLGEDILSVEGIKPGSDEGVLAAKQGESVQALAYYFNEYDVKRELPDREYQLEFKDLTNGTYKLAVYTMDDTHNNTYRLWQRMGAPMEPSEAELSRIYEEQEISADEECIVEVKDGKYVYKAVLSSVSMKLVTLTRI